ncbi:hypothetical protein DSO57_1004058 [Entomophthora muscae]|uniref:Uncharacterized protein n=1 Tax=Entomophthora muscae TaxID=34485 RepID=A0ACC2U650_9FUNG|nr:hypothetical protein DSO57_1004058 [Entomophthora muscae]
MVTEPTTKNPRYPLEKSTWEPLSNLANAQEAVQLYLNKKDQKEGPLGKDGDGVRIVNFLPLKTWAQGWDSNPEPKFLQDAGPMDREPACPRSSEIKPLQAEAPAKSPSQNTSTGSIMMVHKEESLELPNGSREGAPVNSMSLKSSQVTNQTQLPRETLGFGSNPVTTAKNQVTNLDVLTNEGTSSQSAILLLLHPGLLATCPHSPNILMKHL